MSHCCLKNSWHLFEGFNVSVSHYKGFSFQGWKWYCGQDGYQRLRLPKRIKFIVAIGVSVYSGLSVISPKCNWIYNIGINWWSLLIQLYSQALMTLQSQPKPRSIYILIAVAHFKSQSGYRRMFVEIITSILSQKQWFNCARSKGMMADNSVVNFTLIEYLWQCDGENVRR